MTSTVIAIYKNVSRARGAAEALINSSFNHHQITLFGVDENGEYRKPINLTSDDEMDDQVGSEDVVMVAQVADVSADKALETLNRHDPVASEIRGEHWDQSNLADLKSEANLYGPEAAGSEEARYRDALYRATSVNGSASQTSSSGTTSAKVDEFKYLEEYFKTHFEQNFNDTLRPYEKIRPAYRYGYYLGLQHADDGEEWEDVEPEMHRYWRSQSEQSWKVVQPAVFEGWFAAVRQRRSQTA